MPGAAMNRDREIASALVEATEIYRSQGTLGADAGAFNRALVDHVGSLRHHATACSELLDSVRSAVEGESFRAGDYMVYFTLAFCLGNVSLAVILRALLEAVRLSTTTEFGLAWDLIQVAALALATADEPPIDEDTLMLLGQLFATVMTFPIPAGRASELPANIAAVLGQLPPFMAVAICNAVAHGLMEGRPRYDVLAWVAHQQLGAHLAPSERVTFIIKYWLPAIDGTTAEQAILDQAMISAIVALEDARPGADEVDASLRLLLKALAKYPLRARLEYSRHVVRLAWQLSASRAVLALVRTQRANWLASVDRVEAVHELRRVRELWHSEDLPHDVEVNVLLLEAALAFQQGEQGEALRLVDRAIDRASIHPELLAYAESRRSTLGMVLGSQAEPVAPAWSYADHVTRLFSEAVAAFRQDRTSRCVELVDEMLALPRPADASEAQYTRRRAYLLRAAALLRVGEPEASLASVLDAIDEMTGAICRHMSGTEQAARRDRFAEVEALLDRSLQILVQDPAAFGRAAYERLWEALIRYRDIELQFNESVLQLHRTGKNRRIVSLVHDYQQIRNQLATLELDGCNAAPGNSDGDVIARHSRWLDAVRHNLYTTEVALSDEPSFAESVRQRLQVRLGDILAELRADEMIVEFVAFWSGGMTEDGVGLRSLMAFTISTTQLAVVVDRRTVPPLEVVIQALADLDWQPSESIDPPIHEPDLAAALIRRARDAGVRRLLCVPDGPAKTLSLAALPDGEGYLADRLDVVYLGHTADLLLDPPLTVPGQSAVFGDPEFDQPLSESLDACVSDGRPPLQFLELPATAAEASWVAAKLGVRPTSRERATAGAFRTLRSPLVLHVATHGVFNEGPAMPSLLLTGGRGHEAHQRATVTYPRLDPTRPMDPALRSGVALAGINWWLRGLPRGDDGECGYVSAHDIFWMDLAGTRMAVFSGCGTGRGPDERYLGLVDLRRAAYVAGAWELILSIWNVPDTASALLMRLMYQGAADTVPTVEDLGRAQRILREASVADIRSWLTEWPDEPTLSGAYLREILQQPDDRRPFADPYYWAGFVLYTSGRARRSRREKEEGNDGSRRIKT